MRALPNKKAYAKYADRVREHVGHVEHYRILANGQPHRYHHLCVLVMTDGSCYIGTACISPDDVYSRKLGHTICVGRALKKASVYGQDNTDEYVPFEIMRDRRALSGYCHKLATPVMQQLREWTRESERV